MLEVLGPDAKPIVESGDAVADREMMERFVASYEEAHTVKRANGSRFELIVGKDDWPFPIPITKESAGWGFDTAAGQEEILDRRVGRNERFTIQTCLAIVDAQREYYARNPDRDPLNHYARRFNSSEENATVSISPLARTKSRARSARSSHRHGTRATRTSRFRTTATTTASSSPRARMPATAPTTMWLKGR
jgi:hypothetical protein